MRAACLAQVFTTAALDTDRLVSCELDLIGASVGPTEISRRESLYGWDKGRLLDVVYAKMGSWSRDLAGETVIEGSPGLDLHAHPFEAMGVGRASDIRPSHVEELVRVGRAAGLRGIAVTEHGGWAWGRRAAEIAADMDTDGFLIIPGQEHWCYPLEIVEVELEPGAVLRFIAHPGSPGALPRRLDGFGPIHGIEVSNAMHDWHIDIEDVAALADKNDWTMFRNSDAHSLEHIGARSNDISLAELVDAICGLTKSPIAAKAAAE